MTYDFLQDVPAEFRAAWEHASGANKQSRVFEKKIEMEELRNKIRNTSNLYKEIFKETMFGFVTDKGELNLEILVADPEGVFDLLSREISIQATIVDVLKSLPEAKTPVTEEMIEKMGMKDLDIKPKYLTIDMEKVTHFYEEIIKGLKEGGEHLDKFCEEAVKDTSVLYDHHSLYLHRDFRKTYEGVSTFSLKASKVRFPVDAYHYFRATVIPKPMHVAFRNIHWVRELGVK